MSVPDKFFAVQWNADLVHQAVVAHEANARNIVAHAKTRAEVRGGGKKPWKQKGTGRARHGSIRSPLWIGGGVTHGPLKEKVYARAINKKMVQKAIFSVFAKKYAQKQLFVVEGFNGLSAKTKTIKDALKNFVQGRESACVIFSKGHKDLARAVKNMPKARVMAPHSFNVVDLLTPKKVIVDKDAVSEIMAHYTIAKSE